MLSILFILTLSFGNAQNYMDYHRSINNVEWEIVNEKFDIAFAQILPLFDQYDFIFLKDILTAAQLAVLNKQEGKAFKFLSLALQNGWNEKCIRRYPILDNIKDSKNWKALKGNAVSYHLSYQKKIDHGYLSKFSDYYNVEQSSKRTIGYHKVVNTNFAKIQKFIREEGFPGDRLIGVDNELSSPGIESCDCGNSKVIVTLLHQPFAFSKIGEAHLTKAIEQGLLHPREFAMIYTFEKNQISALYDKKIPAPENANAYTFNFPFGTKSDNKDQVNEHRKKFGIVDQEVDSKIPEIEKKYGLKLRYGYR